MENLSEENIFTENFLSCCEKNLFEIETLLHEINSSLTEAQSIGFNHWALALSAMKIGLLVTIVVALIWRR